MITSVIMDCPVDNVLLLADTYKVSHYQQYPKKTSSLYSYFECRKSRFPYAVFFGLQYILKRWLCGPVITKEKIAEAKELFEAHLGQTLFNEEGWNYILEKHGGYLPLRICAVPEGTVLPLKNVLFTIECTDPKVPWITTYFETVLVQVWYPTTVATVSRIHKQIIYRYLNITSDDNDCGKYMLHDFGYRGSTSVESAGIGGGAHLVNFEGTDNVASLMFCRKFYGTLMAGLSVAAAEHSTVTSWGRENEGQALRHVLESIPNGTLSFVCDSYDVYDFLEKIVGGELHDLIVKRGSNGSRLCLRLDSGDPVTVVMRSLNILGKHFGTKNNEKGYKLLPSFVRILQGDGMTMKAIDDILKTMADDHWSADNIIFGSGGALLQQVNRDTLNCAFKCSHAVVDGVERDVFKQPITDNAKTSKKGRLTLTLREGAYSTVEGGKGDPTQNLLVPVYENGKMLKEYSLAEIRDRASLRDDDFDISNVF